MSFVYRQSEPELWTVGHYAPDGAWEPESDHTYRGNAVKRVHYLNGGGHSQGKPIIEFEGFLSVERQDDRIVVRSRETEVIAFYIAETGLKLDKAWVSARATRDFHNSEWAKYVRRLNLSTRAHNELIKATPPITVMDFEMYVLDIINENIRPRGVGIKIRKEIEEALQPEGE